MLIAPSEAERSGNSSPDSHVYYDSGRLWWKAVLSAGGMTIGVNSPELSPHPGLGLTPSGNVFHRSNDGNAR